MNSNLPVGDRLTLVGMLAADTHASGTAKYSDAIDMSQFEAAAFVLPVGTVAATGTAVLQQSKDDTFAAAIELRDAVDLETDKAVQIGVRADELDVNEGYRFVRIKVLGTDGSVKTGAVVLGLNARYQPAAHGADTIIVG